ncbi:hypothetical protein SAY87_009691 [Trapa incisa]|uniref:Uncharacterized protein n=1 Tax=Trapa incisa TaxID=236973 RepID=A0AAN7JYT6_9MYRT|nr:hypothetical protein SAY87_009691 [Trapa incisa]
MPPSFAYVFIARASTSPAACRMSSRSRRIITLFCLRVQRASFNFPGSLPDVITVTENHRNLTHQEIQALAARYANQHRAGDVGGGGGKSSAFLILLFSLKDQDRKDLGGGSRFENRNRNRIRIGRATETVD